MPVLTDLSFETAGSSVGEAGSWTWNRSDSAFTLARYDTPTGFTHGDGFEFEWGADPFVGSLVVPTNAQAFVFGSTTGTPTPYENFERYWRDLARSPTPDPPPDPSHPGNETAFFRWETSQAAEFSVVQVPPSGQPFDNFEVGWLNDVFLTGFAPSDLQAALFESGTDAFEDFEEGWNNDTYQFVMGATTAALYPGLMFPTEPYENFELVFPDEPISPDTATGKINDVATAHANDDLVTLYAGVLPDGTSGLVPTGVNPSIIYFVVNKLANSFKLSLTAGGAAIAFTDNGSGPQFVKADITQVWTLTDVGI